MDNHLDYHIIFNAAGNGMAFTDYASGLIVDVNDAWIRSMGFDREQAIGRTGLDLGLWDQPADRERCLAELERCGRIDDLEAVLLSRSGRTPFLISAKMLDISGRRFILWEFRDISRQKQSEIVLLESEREVKRLLAQSEKSRRMLLSILQDEKRSREALQESEQKYKRLHECAGIGIGYYTPEGVVISYNQVASAYMNGRPEDFTGRSIFELFPGEAAREYLQRIHRACVSDLPQQYEDRVDLPLGQKWFLSTFTRILDAQGNVLGVQVVSSDITERKRSDEQKDRLQAQLTQAQKMESIGRLAGGVAHDFNNMLAVILGHAELALESLHPEHPLFGDLQEIRKAGERSANLTRQLLAFARKQTVDPRVLDLNETMEGMLQMLRRLIGEDIQLEWRPGAHLWAVKVDPSQVDQILANLCVNARDAIGGQGRILIETQTACFDDAFCASREGYIPGDYVMLGVSDNGRGMDRETLDRLFEPFFTTKEKGKGTGLGLATVYGIVRQNRGFIHVCSEPGRGSTFRIYLPRFAGTVGAGPAEKSPESSGNVFETVLLVEDEPAILQMTAKMLEAMGYEVLAATSPGEAIRLAEERAGEIHLLISDVIMPEMTGLELSRSLTYFYPNLKHLFMSGYTADIIAHQGVLDEGVHFIQKPFSRGDLACKVRAVLEQRE